MMLKRWPTVILTATMVALSGCTVNVNVPAEDATTAPAAPAATTAPVAEPVLDPAATAATAPPQTSAYAFVSVFREKLPELATGRADEELQTLADVICGALAKGATSEDVVDGTQRMASRDGLPVDHATANEVIKLAIDTSCPGQASRVDEF